MNKADLLIGEPENEEFHWGGSDDIFNRAGGLGGAAAKSRVHALLDDLFESGAEGSAEGGVSLELGGAEGDYGLSSDAAQEPGDATGHPVSDLGRKERRKVGLKSNYITLEDFQEGIERQCFQIIYNHARFVLGTDATPESIARGIRFFFCQADDEVSFAEAAAAISTTIRRDVILLRFQYEFWKRYMVFENAFEWTALPVPDRVLNQFAYAGVELMADDICTVLAREIWYKPGMHVGEAIELVMEEFPGKYAQHAEDKILEVINHLTDDFLLSRKGDHLWVTLKNPELQLEEWSKIHRQDASRSNIWWTRLF